MVGSTRAEVSGFCAHRICFCPSIFFPFSYAHPSIHSSHKVIERMSAVIGVVAEESRLRPSVGIIMGRRARKLELLTRATEIRFVCFSSFFLFFLLLFALDLLLFALVHQPTCTCSDSDLPTMRSAAEVLESFGINVEVTW